MLIFLGFITAIIGALPFGLVNLTVLNVAYNKNKNAAMQMALGAALVEVLFGTTAILAGNFISSFTSKYTLLNYFIMLVPGFIGVFLLAKRSRDNLQVLKGLSGKNNFKSGIILNFISIQVLLYWIIAIAFLNNHVIFFKTFLNVFVFVLGIWIGKITVLGFYAHLSELIFNKWQVLNTNINRVIGGVLLISVFIQFIN